MNLQDFITKYEGKKIDCLMLEVVSPKYGNNIVLIDFEDLHKIENGTLTVSNSGNNKLYVRFTKSKTKEIYLHRLISGKNKKQIDHINRDTFDNRKENLRFVTQQENLRNQKRKSNQTGYTGVTIFGKKFTAQIKHNYKKHHLGVFNTIKEALKARKQAEKDFGWDIL